MPEREYAIRNITTSFGHSNNIDDRDDNDEEDDNGVILLVGRSGSGKSTLLRLLSGIECPNADGCIVVNGQTMPSANVIVETGNEDYCQINHFGIGRGCGSRWRWKIRCCHFNSLTQRL